jgi:hypothetical protein
MIFSKFIDPFVCRDRAPSIALSLSVSPLSIANYQAACAVRVTNTTGRVLEGRCIVAIEQLSGASWIAPVPKHLVLRTEDQVHAGQSGPFSLQSGESKIVPVLYRLRHRMHELIFIDDKLDSRPQGEENASRHMLYVAARRVELILGAYGGLEPGKFLLRIERHSDWTLIPDLQPVGRNYRLAGYGKFSRWLRRTAY